MRKIAFWRTVGDAYRFLLGNLARFLVLAGGWLIAIIFTVAAAALLSFVSPVLAVVVVIVGAILFYFGGVLAFAVAWHRAILRGDPPRMALHFGPRERRFLGYSALIGLIFFAIAFAGGIVLGGLAVALKAAFGKPGILVAALSPIVAIVAWGFCARLSLALPAAAVDEPGGQLKTAWRRGQGNALRLFFGPIVCAIPIVILQIVLQLVLGPPFWRAGMARTLMAHSMTALPLTMSLLYIILIFAQVAVTVGFLSFSYRQLTAPAAP
jgi:hypothetical protein